MEESFDAPQDESIPVDSQPAFEEPEADSFEEVEESIEAVEPETFDDLDEAIETIDPAPSEAAPSEPAGPSNDDFDSDEDSFEGEEFEELEEEFDDSLFLQMLKPGTVNQLANTIRVGRNGEIIWTGEVILPTLHRRY